MISQVDELTSYFERKDITYWVDSGTLLGLIRDGELLDSDPDLDFGVWEDEFKDAEQLNITGNYKVQRRFYNDQLYKVKYIPKNKDGNKKTFDINLFRKADNMAWCPAGMIENPYTPGTIRYSITHGFRAIAKFFNRTTAAEIHLDKYPIKLFTEIGIWKIPIRYYQGSTQLEEYGYTAPHPVDEYLEYRYGNWEKEADNWSYWDDDGGIVHSSPTELGLLE